MSKPVVFLLVVISSLLTYVSTGLSNQNPVEINTEPTVEPDPKPEVWEYFQGYHRYYKEHNAALSDFWPRTEVVRVTPVGKVKVEERPSAGEWEWTSSFEIDDGLELSFKPDFSGSLDLQKFVPWARSESGKKGWHIFQIDKKVVTEDTPSTIEHYTYWHWRRRVP